MRLFGAPEHRLLSCMQAEEWMMLRIYQELPAKEAALLNQHLAGCENCRREMASLRALEETLSQGPRLEISTELLHSTRIRLAEALDAERDADAQRSRWFQRSVLHHVQLLRAAPLAAAAMLLLGVGLGSMSGYQVALRHGAKVETARVIQTVPPANSPIASVSSVSPQPDGKGIAVSYNRLVPESATGSADDPFIRRVLAMGVQSPTDPSVQDDSVRLLAEACEHGPHCDDNPVRSALMTAARYDADASLRSKALHDLQPYVAQDTRVRDAVLEAVMNDRSPEVRAQAVQMLSPVEADSSVRQVLHNASTRDSDPQVRSMLRAMSQQALDVGLEIQ